MTEKKQGRAKARPYKDLGRSGPEMSRENGAQKKKKGKTASSRSFTRELVYHN